MTQAAAKRMQVTHRTPIVVEQEMSSHFFQRWRWSFTVTLEDGTKRHCTGTGTSQIDAANTAIRFFGQVEERGIEKEQPE